MSDPIDQEPMNEEEREEMEDDNEMEESEDSEEEMAEEDEKNKKQEVYLPGKALKKGEELVVDHSAYRILHQAQTGAPCLSFDVIKDNLGSSRETYPLSMYMVAGTQAARAHVNNLLVMKMSNLVGIKSNSEESDDDSDLSDSEDEEETSKRLPVMTVASIKHQGCVNRVRTTRIGKTSFAASWSELGRVNIFNLEEQLRAIESPSLLLAYNKNLEKAESAPKPIFSFTGHTVEGFGLDWCPTEPGTLASGDCKGNVHIWRHSDSADWLVDQRPYNSHAPASVEDLQWSPTEKNVLASCSVDKSIRIWDTRVSPQSACMLTASEAHDSDINVISWNRKESCFIVSGGDDGFLKIWDLRRFGNNPTTPVASFKQHTAPVTTVEWHPEEGTVFASGGADDQIAQWDLSAEHDQNDGEQDNELAGLPPQLLFIHQGQSDVKELHWHPQCPGTIISTAHSGFNIFRTISV